MLPVTFSALMGLISGFHTGAPGNLFYEVCKKSDASTASLLLRDLTYKPGSVIDSHLSRRIVANTLQPPKRKQPGKPCFHCGVAPDRVYRAARFHTAAGELLPRLSTLTPGAPVHYQASVEAHKG